MTKQAAPDTMAALDAAFDKKLKEAQHRVALRELPLPRLQMRRLAREAAGLSQQDLAEILGVTRQWIHMLESGDLAQPSGELRARYREVLHRLIRRAAEAELVREAAATL